MASQFSGIAIILFIAFGSLTFILLFIFAKRQITRFALKSRRGPHFPVAMDAEKRLRLEVERRLDVIDKIQCEAWLLSEAGREQFEDDDISQLSPTHLYRMKVVDDVKELSNLILTKNSLLAKRFHENTIQYYLRLHKDGAMPNVKAECLYRFLTLYENARHNPDGFGPSDYAQFAPLLKIIKQDALNLNSSPQSQTEAEAEAEAETEAKSKVNAKENEVLMDESVTPLLNRSKSGTKGSLSSRKFAHETTV